MYSPQIRARLIPALYRLSQAERKPMTQVVSDAIEELLIQQGFPPEEINRLLPEAQRRRLAA